jgi:D-serine deaminase-like pyridoxal phosphate-dependent protein
LLLDLDRFRRNVARMAPRVRAAGKTIRPHAKTTGVEIAQRQIARGAGVTCAKLGEAE